MPTYAIPDSKDKNGQAKSGYHHGNLPKEPKQERRADSLKWKEQEREREDRVGLQLFGV